MGEEGFCSSQKLLSRLCGILKGGPPRYFGRRLQRDVSMHGMLVEGRCGEMCLRMLNPTHVVPCVHAFM